jgi:hypothetical protein
MQITHRTPRPTQAITGQPITSRALHLTPRRLRNVGLAAAAAVAVAVAGYGAIQTLGPSDHLGQRAAGLASPPAIPNSQARREMRDAIAAQYGAHPASAEISRRRATREMRDTIANLYGPATTTTPSANAQAMREMRDTIANLYGPATTTTPSANAQAMRQVRDTIANLYGDRR